MLLALAREAGREVVDLGIARDDEDLIVAILEDAFTRCDAVITSGGVSVGDYDYVKAALDRFGVARVATGRDQAREAARVRRRRAACRCSACPATPCRRS